VRRGQPTGSYPFAWAIYGWIDGHPYADALVDDERRAAEELAQFVGELRRVDPVGLWVHGDLLRPNRLVRDGRLRAVIDFGGAGAGDPATDVVAAWSVFGRAGRAVFRAALDVDDDNWNRARGLALHQAALIIPHYAETNPGFVAPARRTVEEILADSQL
jgi:aminoglycoside phosphotransferase (APT) family kinase protein